MRLIILTILLPHVLSLCSSLCQQCSNNNNDLSAYACLSCYPSNDTPYISTCPLPSDQFNFFIAPAVIVTLLHVFLLSVGMGMYRQIFQHIQLASLVGLRYDFQGGSISIQATNFAIVNSNDFLKTYGYQFIALLLILSVFLLVVTCTDKMVHTPAAALVRRKKIIFPVRLMTVTFNALLLSSLLQISNINEVMTLQVAPFVLAVLAIGMCVVELVVLAVISNWKKFQIDDPNYYVLVEQMTSKKWYSKNNVFFSLLTRTIIICVYVGLYRSPGVSGIVMVLMQAGYTIYFIALIRFTKIRYFVATIVGNILMIAVLMTVYIGSINEMGSSIWQGCKLGYIAVLMVMVVLFFWVQVTEIIFRRERVVKQLKSFYNRFIRCEKLEEEIEVNKYDEHGHREKVKQFHTNLLFQRDVNEDRAVEMQQTSSK